jgi:hypothetical protein
MFDAGRDQSRRAEPEPLAPAETEAPLRSAEARALKPPFAFRGRMRLRAKGFARDRLGIGRRGLVRGNGRGGLVRVLDTGLAADGADAEGRAVGLTFRDQGGVWCRTFNAGDAGGRGDGRDPDGVERDARGRPERRGCGDCGETVDAAAEAAARDRSWR